MNTCFEHYLCTTYRLFKILRAKLLLLCQEKIIKCYFFIVCNKDHLDKPVLTVYSFRAFIYLQFKKNCIEKY